MRYPAAVVALVLLAAGGGLAGSCRESKLCCPGRDSSCVVQKAPINAIIEDLSDKPCYCDHACLKLGDCCSDFKDACGVVDCRMSAWGPWSECDAECGPGRTTRTRTIERPPINGGKHCSALVQKRACIGQRCPRDQRQAALRETAMLLPASLGWSRDLNATHDIRRNLRLRYPKDPADENEYCVPFEVIKASKACRKEKGFTALREGSRVCVRCETQAIRKALGYRCQGHGVVDRATRWSALAAPHCHGKWVRLESDQPEPDDPAEEMLGDSPDENQVDEEESGGAKETRVQHHKERKDKTVSLECPSCKKGALFIFV